MLSGISCILTVWCSLTQASLFQIVCSLYVACSGRIGRGVIHLPERFGDEPKHHSADSVWCRRFHAAKSSTRVWLSLPCGTHIKS